MSEEFAIWNNRAKNPALDDIFILSMVGGSIMKPLINSRVRSRRGIERIETDAMKETLRPAFTTQVF